jgi:hypothetical protein
VRRLEKTCGYRTLTPLGTGHYSGIASGCVLLKPGHRAAGSILVDPNSHSPRVNPRGQRSRVCGVSVHESRSQSTRETEERAAGDSRERDIGLGCSTATVLGGDVS